MRLVKPVLVGLAALLATWNYLSEAEVRWNPGELAPDEPAQTMIHDAASFSRQGFAITPRAQFSARVRVLSKERYWLGDWAKLSPLDFAVGWGPMSDSAVLDSIEISQSGRFFFWRAAELPAARAVIERSAANWHLVPASASLARQLEKVRKGDIIVLRGTLIDLESPDHQRIRTSLTRGDTGAGACEVVWVEKIEIAYR